MADQTISGAITPEGVLPWLRAGVTGGREFTMTLKSLATGVHLTYRMRPVKRAAGDVGVGHHVMVDTLTGPSNTTDYTFVGAIYLSPSGRIDVLTGPRTQRPDGSHGSPIGNEAPSAKTLHWLFDRLGRGLTPAPQAEVWHDGTCARCGQPLTRPESVASGLGPICGGRE